MTAFHFFPEFEDGLRRIPGILRVRVVTTADGRPIEIHAITDMSKAPKDFVRDVQAVAMADYDLDIDYRIVSIVQMAPESVEVGDPTPAADSPESSAAPETRPALTSISVSRAGGDAVVTVSLGIGESVFTGQSAGPSSQIHRARIVAQATLAALDELLGIAASIESSQVLEVGLREVAITTLTVQIPKLGEQVLCGSALVRGDAEDAVARSVLAAVNRRLSG
jgi:hypothetical protein